MLPVHRCKLFRVVQLRLTIYKDHVLAQKEILRHMNDSVPFLMALINEAAGVYATLLQTKNPVAALATARVCYEKALNEALSYLDELPLEPLLSAIQSLQLMLQHHDSLVCTFSVGINVKV